MKVLHVIESGGIGGAQRALEVIAVRSAERGISCAVAAPCDGSLIERLSRQGIPGFEMPIDRRLDSRPGRIVRELVRREKFQIVHVHTPKAGMLVRRAAHEAGARVLMHAHGLGTRAMLENMPFGPIARLKKYVLWALERSADLATDFFIVETTPDLTRNYYPREKSALVYNGLRPEDWPFSLPPDDPIILFPARLSLQKDPLTLLRACVLLREQSVEFRLQMAGEGELSETVRAAARDLGLGNRVEFLKERLQGPALYEKAMIVALTTHIEGQPFAILEAMAMGRPIVATACGAIPETLGDAGFLVSKDPSEVAARLAILLRDPDLRRSLAHAARRRLEAEFTEDKMIENVLEVYRRMLA